MTGRERSRQPGGGAHRAREDAGRAPERGVPEAALVRIHDLAGRPRGTGFVADHHGTVVTSHEAVDGLPRLVLHTAGDRSCLVTADAVTPLPELDLALVRTEGLGVDPLPVTVRDRVETGTYVRVAAGRWREARVLGTTSVTYAATDRFRVVDEALELAIGTAGQDALRLGGGAAGGPVVDAETGAVLAVLGTALQSGHRDTGFAVPLRPAPPGPLADLLARNAATVPAYGADLNLAGVLELTATSVGQDGPPGTLAGYVGRSDAAPPTSVEPVERAVPAREFTAFTQSPAAVLGLVGAPGSGRTTELATLAARRNRGPEPSPTLWLRGADLHDEDTSIEAAAGRALARAARIVSMSASTRGAGADLGDRGSGGLGDAGRSGVAGAWSGGLGDAGPGRMAGAGSGGLGDAGRSGVAGAWSGGLGDAGPGRVADAGSGGLGDAGRSRVADGGSGGLGDVGPGRMAGAGSGGSGDAGAGRTAHVGAGRTAGAGAGRMADAGSKRTAGAGPKRTAGAGVSGLGDAGPTGLGDAGPTGLGDTGPARVADVARAAGRPLLLLLDGPEEMPPVLAHRLDKWTEGTATWLAETGARLVVGCRAEYWEGAGAAFPRELLYTPTSEIGGDPCNSNSGTGPHPCVHLGDLQEDEARKARARYRIPEDTLAAPDARHPLTLRLLSEVRTALPDTTPHPHLDRNDVFAAYLDLMCLRVAVRLAAENGLRGTAVRRLAAKVSGQVHEAARRSLGPGQGELDRASFEAVFPWGQAPAGLGGGTGWASAVLTEGLLVPAGNGYRFAHEELADWIQGMHLDLDEALNNLVHRRRTPDDTTHPLPVPRHRIGPVVQALLLLARERGTAQLAARLEQLTQALETHPHSWWPAHLLTETLLRVPDARPYLGVLRRLADAQVETARRDDPPSAPTTFTPAFWTALPLPEATRFDLLRRLLLADGPPDQAPATTPTPRFLDTVSHLLAADPTAVQPLLTHWFDDDRPLPATPHATVAKAAQALLHTHRQLALDDLTEALVECAHRRADELLAVLAEDEPSAVCRAVDRWAHDERPARRVAAVAYGLRAAPHVRTDADRELLRYVALALLARPADCTLHGGALALLVRDPRTRARHLPQALRHFAAGDPHFPPSALVAALTTDPEPVLDAFRARLRGPDAGAALRTLADVTTPPLARRVAALVREAVERRPETAADVAAYVDRRLDQGAGARAVLLPLVTGLLDGGTEDVRAALAVVLAAPGAPVSRPLRSELLECLLAHEQAPAVLDALLHATALHTGDDIRDLVHRTGLLLVRTPDGAARFDRGLVDLGRRVPGFAARMAGWLTDAPQTWAAVVGPSTRRMIENLSGVRVPA
ncbi:serine protease [Streptomyces sp. CA-249302]|uniref:serine protease n=1 Tax=Streptomyces sp. CA-249302 TaxID=3240058 RepID=UPI003D93718F